MEEAALKETGVDQWREGLARQVEERRQKARQMLSRGRERLRELEVQLGQRIDHLARQVTQEEARSAAADERTRIVEERQRELSSREQKAGHLLEDVQRRKEATMDNSGKDDEPCPGGTSCDNGT